MKKEQTIEKLTHQLKYIDNFQQVYLTDDFYQWKRDTEITIEHIFGSDKRHLTDFKEINFIAKYASRSENYTSDGISQDGLKQARAVLRSMIEEVKNHWDELIDHKPVITSLEIIENICDKFHLLVRQLKIRHDNRNSLEINDEYDVQDLFHALLMLYFDDIRDEEWTPSYAGRASRTDFLLKKEQTIVELKKTRKGLAAKEIGEQLIIDIQRYQSHPNCKTLVCFVYDPEGIIKNPRGIENDLTKVTDGLTVKVFIRPK